MTPPSQSLLKKWLIFYQILNTIITPYGVLHLQCEFDHDSIVTCLDLDSANMRVVSGTKDGK